MKGFKAAFVFFVLYLVFLLATIPASFVIHNIPLPKNVELGMASGSIWQGKLDTAHVDGILIKNISWSVSFSQLLTGKAAVDFRMGSRRRLNEPYGTGTAFIGFQGMGLTQTKLSVPASIAMPKLQALMVESLAGTVNLDVKQYLFDQPYCAELDASVLWKQSALGVMGSQFSLGDLKLNLACQEGNLAVVAKGDDKVLMLDVTATLKDKFRAKVDGKVKAGSEADKALMAAMSFLGRADPQGFYTLRYGS